MKESSWEKPRLPTLRKVWTHLKSYRPTGVGAEAELFAPSRWPFLTLGNGSRKQNEDPTTMEEAPQFPPEYVGESNAARIVGVVGAFHFLALTFVSLRLYVRLFMVRAFGVDDVLVILAVVSATLSILHRCLPYYRHKKPLTLKPPSQLLALGSWICLVLQIPYGLGRHGLTIPVEDRIKFEHITFWKTVLSDGVALGLLRISMAITLLRLKRDSRWYTWSLYAVIGIEHTPRPPRRFAARGVGLPFRNQASSSRIRSSR